jgi:GT2 family glycosyltransferase
VVVLSWHGSDDTVRCVESLVDGNADAHVLVVDNGSYDGVLERVTSAWPHVDVLQTGANLGFAGGMNRGIRWALDAGADVITILNNDTVVDSGVTAELARRATTDRALSPEIRYLEDPEAIWFGAGAVDPDDLLPHHVTPPSLEPVRGLRSSGVLTGCCISAHSHVWRRVGGFDERFFLNFEDSEWSLRARSLGYGLFVDTDVHILHSVSASFRSSAPRAGAYFYVRNGLLFNRLVGGGIRSKVLFLRRHVVPSVMGSRREGREALLRSAVVAGWGLWSFATRRFGPMPSRLDRVLAGWRE